MAANDPIVVDTCIWVPFFNHPGSIEKRRVDELIDDDRATLLGPILAEILLGFRRAEHADWVASTLRGLRWIEISWEDWRTAARLGRQLASQGDELPLSDLAIAAVCVTRGLALYTSDPHFDLIPELKRHAGK